MRFLPPSPRTGAARNACARRLRRQSDLDVDRHRPALRGAARGSARPVRHRQQRLFTRPPRAARGERTRPEELVAGGAHRRPSAEARRYLASSEFCGAATTCGCSAPTYSGLPSAGEHFKRLRNAYSEWQSYSAQHAASGKKAASCQDCHMSSFPGVCVPNAGAAAKPRAERPSVFERACPEGTRFEPRAPGVLANARIATVSAESQPLHSHYFSGVDVPLAPEFLDALVDEGSLDSAGIPLGARQRRDLLLASSVRLRIVDARNQRCAARGPALDRERRRRPPRPGGLQPGARVLGAPARDRRRRRRRLRGRSRRSQTTRICATSSSCA